jgi:calcineurin-like phosphoesterase family protein
MATWFTADTHFGHEAIIRLAGRPFASVEEMDTALIANWNRVVAAGDLVWHLGDFCYRASHGPEYYRARLNGKIHLIAGNHDTQTVKHHAGLFVSIDEIREIESSGEHILLCHYPMREWPGAWRGAWHLFGHVHGRLDDEPLGLSLDVGVDSHQFAPIAIGRIRELLAGRTNPFSGGDGK